jgi:hypothetical protein
VQKNPGVWQQACLAPQLQWSTDMALEASPMEPPRAPVIDPAFRLTRGLLSRLLESWWARPDYYGELLRQHPEIDPEVMMKIT